MAHGFQFIHYYTMNLEASVIQIIERNGTLDKKRALPFTKPTAERRADEEVRPIFWANKPKSYINKTSTWDNFPNGRWGSSFSPAFKAEEEGFVSFSKKSHHVDKIEKRKLWGEEINTLDAVSDVFTRYVTRQLKKFPFSEGPLMVESNQIRDILKTLNENHFLTINSQPKVNGVKSSDPVFGWGPKNGFIYQKAYFEFFISKDLLDLFINFLQEHEMISYQATNVFGDIVTNVKPDAVNAVTWGIFMNQQVIQPTVVDFTAFMIWKDEAFSSWSKWAQIYEAESESFQLLQRIHDTFYLMNIVDNDYIEGNLT